MNGVFSFFQILFWPCICILQACDLLSDHKCECWALIHSLYSLDDYGFVSFVHTVFDISERFSVSRNGKKVKNSMLNSASGHQTFWWMQSWLGCLRWCSRWWYLHCILSYLLRLMAHMVLVFLNMVYCYADCSYWTSWYGWVCSVTAYTGGECIAPFERILWFHKSILLIL